MAGWLRRMIMLAPQQHGLALPCCCFRHLSLEALSCCGSGAGAAASRESSQSEEGGGSSQKGEGVVVVRKERE
uniref:Uncharacterized protein n=1 Tax=Physcomitrium patens TaxID=3218 RepID=A0A2K1JZS3_PHYPA|nr:hypothetical protein PHYPA_014143 [Physcomitrium patens]